MITWCCGQRGRKRLEFEWEQLAGYPFRNDHFSPDEWDVHLTFRRFLPEFRVLAIAVISMSPLWMWTVFVSVGIGLYATYAEPHGAPNVSNHSDFIVPFTLTGFALSLLMLFKTNSSYGRWWEARIAMGRLLVYSRNINRLCFAHVGRKVPYLLPSLHRWTSALTPALSAYLRKKQHYFGFLEGVMHPEELAWLRQHPNPPVGALQVISELLERATLLPMELMQLQEQLNNCDQVVGTCERILRQPLPPGYSRHTQRFLMTYITFLPFALWPLFEWATCPIMAVLAFLLLAIENIGVHLEEPFRVLPLNQMIEGTMKQLQALVDTYRDAARMAAFAVDVAAMPAEVEPTVLRKSHADFSPRASKALKVRTNGLAQHFGSTPPLMWAAPVASAAAVAPAAPVASAAAAPAAPAARSPAATAPPPVLQLPTRQLPGRALGRMPSLPFRTSLESTSE